MDASNANTEARLIVGEVFKLVKQEADCHEDQIDEVSNIPATFVVNITHM